MTAISATGKSGVAASRVYHRSEALPAPAMHRPLIVIDVDEVVLAFVDALEAWLGARELHLARDGFALNGNVRRTDGEAVTTVELRSLLHGFFDEAAHDMAPLPGAIDGIASFSPAADVVFLSNLPAAAAVARRTNLDALGLRHALIVNEGPKGPALARLVAGMAAPVVFMDDSPSNIASARAAVPAATLVHFVADAGFRATLTPGPDIALFTGDWDEAARFVTDNIDGYLQSTGAVE